MPQRPELAPSRLARSVRRIIDPSTAAGASGGRPFVASLVVYRWVGLLGPGKDAQAERSCRTACKRGQGRASAAALDAQRLAERQRSRARFNQRQQGCDQYDVVLIPAVAAP